MLPTVPCEQPLKVVVTGASGFLGGHVLRALASRQNIEIIAVSRRDISGWIRVSDYSESPVGDVLIHLAEDGDRTRVAETGGAYEEAVNATLIALLAKDYSRVVYASSAILYGDRDMRPHFPVDPVQVNDTYSRIKRHSELAILESPAGIVGRLANVYGPGMSKNNVMSTFLQQIPGEGSVKVMDTSPVRDFLWVEDAAEGIVALALNNFRKIDHGGVFNLGTGAGTSIGSLVSIALEIAGQPGRAVETKRSSGRQSSLVLDFSDTMAACGWQPKTSLRAGLTHLLRTKEEKK